MTISRILLITACLLATPAGAHAQDASTTSAVMKATYSDASGIGQENGIMRRDPSDIIKVGDLYYVWYSKGAYSHGYEATVWFATSPDGHKWTEKGESVFPSVVDFARSPWLTHGNSGEVHYIEYFAT